MKKWYWVVDCDNTVENPYVSGIEDLNGVEEWTLEMGRPLENWNENSWIAPDSAEEDGDPDDVLQNHLGLLIFSSRLRKALDNYGIAGIQYLPIQVLRIDRSPMHGFSIANILNVVPALDLEKSDYDVYPEDYFAPEDRGRVSGIRMPVLNAGPLEPFDIIRPKEFIVEVYVSEVFRDVFLAGGFTGCTFPQIQTVP